MYHIIVTVLVAFMLYIINYQDETMSGPFFRQKLSKITNMEAVPKM